MYCSNCGAEINDNVSYCPYCGVMNVRAAENEYMEKLEDIREDTEQLTDVSEHQTRAGIRHAGRKTFIVLLIVAFVAAGFFMLGRFLERQLRHESANRVQKELEFKDKYFTKLDEYYAAGDDAATADYLSGISAEDGSSILDRWKHYTYMQYYEDYRYIRSVSGMEINDHFRKYDYADILYAGIELIYETRSYYAREMSAEEKAKVKKMQGEAEETFAEYLSLNRSDLDEAYEYAVSSDGYLSASRVREWAGNNERF